MRDTFHERGEPVDPYCVPLGRLLRVSAVAVGILLAAACAASPSSSSAPPGDRDATDDASSHVSPPVHEWVKTLADDGVVRLGANAFDLAGKTLRFDPIASVSTSGYRVAVLPLAFDADLGPRLDPAAGRRGGDAVSWNVPLSFSFPIGGERFDVAHVNLGGSVTFGASEADSWMERNPFADGGMRSLAAAVDVRAAAGLERMIAANWAIYDDRASRVHVHPHTDRVVVTWIATRPRRPGAFYLPAGEALFQASLFSRGAIELAYKTVPERDGLVGVFQGGDRSGPVLDSVIEGRDAIDPAVDIDRIDVLDLGSVLELRFTMFGPVPAPAAGRNIEYRAWLEHEGRRYLASFRVRDRLSAGGDGYGAPSITGYRLGSTTLEPTGLAPEQNVVALFVSKLVFDGASQIRWTADVVDWSEGRGFDGTDTRSFEQVPLRSGADLSAGIGTPTTSAFEVFHYPVFPRAIEVGAREIYRHFPADDDFLVMLTDERFDDLFGHGPSTGPINVPIRGIGHFPAHPGNGADFGSSQLQVGVSVQWVGQPRFDERTVDDVGRAYTHHAFALGYYQHEITHRWAAYLGFSRPAGTKIPLGDGYGHWIDGLDSRSAALVAGGYSDAGYPEVSPMGGFRWEGNGDGTYRRMERPYLVPVGFSYLDLYALGLLEPAEVHDTFVLEGLADLGDNRWTARSRTPVRIDDVIAAEAPRDPPAGGAQRRFAMGVYLFHSVHREPNPNMLSRAEEIAARLAELFEAASGGRMTVVP